MIFYVLGILKHKQRIPSTVMVNCMFYPKLPSEDNQENITKYFIKISIELVTKCSIRKLIFGRKGTPESRAQKLKPHSPRDICLYWKRQLSKTFHRPTSLSKQKKNRLYFQLRRRILSKSQKFHWYHKIKKSKRDQFSEGMKLNFVSSYHLFGFK